MREPAEVAPALRQEAFDEVYRSSARRSLVWVAATHVFVVFLHVREGHMLRGSVQLVLALVHGAAIWQQASIASSESRRASAGSVAALALVLSAANTGGLTSPILALGIPPLVASSTHPQLAELTRRRLPYVVGCLLLLALASHTEFGAAPQLLRGGALYASWMGVAFTLAMTAYVAMTTHALGRSLARVYSSVLEEAHVRTRELFEENEDRTRALEGVAARLAHEVKNPLAAIRALSTHVARNTQEQKTAERLAIVSAEAERLQGILDGFLSFSRGLDDLRIAKLVPLELANQIANLLELRSRELGIKLLATGDPAVFVQADTRKIRQVLLNLVINALQASPRGKSVQIRVAAGAAGGAELSVIDAGAGMPAEVVERIKRPYFTTREGGSGIGVAVARGLVQQHGGSLEYQSEVGVGTTVTVRLPSTVPLSAIEPALPMPAGSRSPSTTSKIVH